MSNRRWLILPLLAALLFGVSCNPFAPALDEDGLIDEDLLGDRTTIDGLFEYFKNTYEIRDTSLYGRMFSKDFTFTYYDFDLGAEISWDRGQEMISSHKLFRGVQQITLDWNFYVEREESDTLASVVRSFNLTIVEQEDKVYNGTGRAKLRMRRATATDPWLIYYWFDDSDF
jgi:hypothetical protein